MWLPGTGAGVDLGEQWPTGPVTLLLAETGLEAVLDEAIARHGGTLLASHVGLAGLGEGDSVAAMFARASDAVACALDLQRAPLGPLRVCLHAGRAQPGAGDGYLDPATSRAARLLDLAHGGQILLSDAAGDLVTSGLPDGAWLADLGSHRLADLAPAERVLQL